MNINNKDVKNTKIEPTNIEWNTTMETIWTILRVLLKPMLCVSPVTKYNNPNTIMEIKDINVIIC